MAPVRHRVKHAGGLPGLPGTDFWRRDAAAACRRNAVLQRAGARARAVPRRGACRRAAPRADGAASCLTV
ncbi:hypothetical protein AGIG_G9101 [Arapaima gigas]